MYLARIHPAISMYAVTSTLSPESPWNFGLLIVKRSWPALITTHSVSGWVVGTSPMHLVGHSCTLHQEVPWHAWSGCWIWTTRQSIADACKTSLFHAECLWEEDAAFFRLQNPGNEFLVPMTLCGWQAEAQAPWISERHREVRMA